MRAHVPVSWLTMGCDIIYVTKWWRLSNCSGPKKHRPVVVLCCINKWRISPLLLKDMKIQYWATSFLELKSDWKNSLYKKGQRSVRDKGRERVQITWVANFRIFLKLIRKMITAQTIKYDKTIIFDVDFDVKITQANVIWTNNIQAGTRHV